MLAKVSIPSPETRLYAFPHELSGGMRQRVVGAIAISRSPDVLIADEPTTSLDATVQLQYLKLLKEIQQNTGAAIIFITHDLGIVARMCDRVEGGDAGPAHLPQPGIHNRQSAERIAAPGKDPSMPGKHWSPPCA